MKKIFPLILIHFFFFNYVNAQNSKKNQINPDCDTSETEVFIVAEEMPKYDLECNQIEKLITESLGPAYIRKAGNLSFYIGLEVDCKGNAYRYRTLRTSDTLISNKIIEVLKTNLKWTSGKQRGKPVNCAINLKFEIKNGTLKWISQQK